jgi:hypothetical protein
MTVLKLKQLQQPPVEENLRLLLAKWIPVLKLKQLKKRPILVCTKNC